MRPWMIVVATLAISGVLFACGILVGASRSDRHWLVEKSKLEKAITDKETERKKAVKDLEDRNLQFNQKLTTELAQQEAQLRQEGDDREKKVREYYRRHPNAAVAVADSTASLWRETNGEGRANGSGQSSDSTPASRVDVAAEGCTVADLHLNHEALVNEYKAMRLRFVKLQAWAAEAYETCSSQVP